MNDDIATRKTYRYLRIGMVAAVVLLAASVLLEHQNATRDCWQTSISAYYYTPVRAAFVGVLMAIGLTLIVIKGSTVLEDAALNVAGILAPVVALVPTSDHGTCWSIPPIPLPTVENPSGDDPLAEWVVANIDNNIRALLYAGVFGLVAAVVIAGIAVAVGKKRGENPAIADAMNEQNRGTVLGLIAAALFLAVAFLLFRYWDGFNTRSHGYAALAMFGALAVAAAVNAWECRRVARRRYAWLYLVIAVLMVATAGFMFATGWNHRILAIETIEIGLFAAFWLVQTRELWHDTVRS